MTKKSEHAGDVLQDMGFMGQMVLSMLNGMLKSGGKFSDQLYMTAKVKVRSVIPGRAVDWVSNLNAKSLKYCDGFEPRPGAIFNLSKIPYNASNPINSPSL